MDGTTPTILLGDDMKFLAFAALAALMTACSAQATVISFDTDAAKSPFTGTYAQNGYNITYVSGGLRLLNNNSAFGDVLAGGNATGGSFDLARIDGGLFSIESFLGGSGLTNTTVRYSLLGYLAGANIYSQTLSATGTTPRNENFFRFDPTPTVNTFDRINFSMSSSQSSPIIDNISVTEINSVVPDPVPTPGPILPPITSAVPEPATWAMMLVGFGLVGGTMRRRKQLKIAVRFA